MIKDEHLIFNISYMIHDKFSFFALLLFLSSTHFHLFFTLKFTFFCRALREMASFFVTGATLLSLANGLTLPRQAAHYHYMPTEYQYGEDSRVTTNITFGTAPDAQPVKIVMDSGSSAFWVSDT